jgi:hypothetical protein
MITLRKKPMVPALRAESHMTNQHQVPNARQYLVDRLVKETGVTQSEARDLVAILGSEWSSLVREARMIARAPTSHGR